MSSLPKQIAERFFDELAESDDVSAEQVQALRMLMEKGSKLKAADI